VKAAPLTPRLSRILREILADRGKSERMLQHAFKEALTAAHVDGLTGAALAAYGDTVRGFYTLALDLVHTHSQSPIETIFLTSLVFAFLYGDPTSLVLEAPRADFPVHSQDRQIYYKQIVDCDTGIRQSSGDERNIFTYIDYLEKNNKFSRDEAEFHRSQFIMLHEVGFAEAFHISLQAGFPKICVQSRRIRTDLAIYVPAHPQCKVVVECDGFTFHGSKEQFTVDRQRDRLLQANGYSVFRFSGPEIWHDPAKAAVELYDYLQSLDRSGG
jgi:hypothetical protein